MARFGAFRSAAIAILSLLLMPQVLVRAQEKQAAKSAPAANSDSLSSDYAGAESCKSCHEEIYNGWEKSPHWKQTYKEGGIAKHGCEDCHGAGASHVADPTDTSKLFLFEKASTKEIDCALPDVPRRRHSAHECHQLGAFEERRQLRLLPFAAPR